MLELTHSGADIIQFTYVRAHILELILYSSHMLQLTYSGAHIIQLTYVRAHIFELILYSSHMLELTFWSSYSTAHIFYSSHMGGFREWTGGPDPPPLKNHKNVGFLCNTGPDPLKNHKATKSASNVGPISAHQRNAISLAFRRRADDGPIRAVFGSSIPHQLKNQIWTPSDKTFWIRAFRIFWICEVSRK